MESKKRNVLIIGNFHHQDDFNASAKSSELNMNCIWVNEDEDCLENGCTSLPKSLEKIERIIEEKSIDQVIAMCDDTALLHATLVDKYPER